MFEKIDKYKASIIACLICFVLGAGCVFTIYKTKTSDELEKFQTIYEILKDKWYYSNSIENLDTQLVEQAISGMVDFETDAHTNYFTMEQASQFSSSLEGSNVGIGMTFYLDANNNMVCKKVFVDSPAEKAKLRSGDVLIQVGDKICSENDSQDIISYIKENENKELKIQYIRNNTLYQTSMTPCSYDATVVCEMYDDYGYIILNSFSENSAKSFHSAMKRLEKEGIKKLVLDLRDDSGGYLTSVLDIASCLLEKDSVVFLEEKKQETTEQKTSNEYDCIDMDSIVILQNENTASAAEVLIGALKDNLKDKITTVGTTTYGKGTEQVSIPFEDGTSLKYTIAQWKTPNGTSINNKGFKPDIEVNRDEVISATYKQMEEGEIIQKDRVHTNAKALQIYLDYLGYNVDRKDTYFSIESSNALKQYQMDHNLEATGDCDEKTFQLIASEVLLKINETHLDVQYDKAISLIVDMS